MRVLFLRSNPIDPDPRVEKEARALIRSGFSVKVIGWDRSGNLPVEETKQNVIIYRIPLKANYGQGLKNLPYLIQFQIALTRELMRRKSEYDVIHACDLDTVLPALWMKLIYKKRVVYDIFDFYADMLRRVPTWAKFIARMVELWAIGKADAVIIADDNRKNQIQGSHPKRLVIIYNTPEIVSESPLPLPIPPLRIAYVGLLQKERGIMEMLQVLEKHPEWNLDLAGFGGDEDEIKEVAEKLSNVRYHGRVSYDIALDIMSKAHVLFATYDPSIANHRYSSPNKVFEAMALGRPIIVSEGMGIDKLVNDKNLGFVVPYGKVDALENVMLTLSKWSNEDFTSFRKQTLELYQSLFSWQVMEDKLVKVYFQLHKNNI